MRNTNGYEKNIDPDAGTEAERGCVSEFYKHVRHPRSRPAALPVPDFSDNVGQVYPKGMGLLIFRDRRVGKCAALYYSVNNGSVN